MRERSQQDVYASDDHKVTNDSDDEAASANTGRVPDRRCYLPGQYIDVRSGRLRQTVGRNDRQLSLGSNVEHVHGEH
jgi:hypothetical protein